MTFTVICDIGDPDDPASIIELARYTTYDGALKYKEELENKYLLQGRCPPELYIKEKVEAA